MKVLRIAVIVLLLSLSANLNTGLGFKLDAASEKSFEWLRDEDGNGIDDLIDALPEDERVNILIDYWYHPTERDIKMLSNFDLEIKYVYRYINAICARNVLKSDVEKIAKLPGIKMVEKELIYYANLDVSARAIQARESDEYSPQTATDLGFLGGGISIAILDTGVDDGGISPTEHHASLDDLDDNPATNDPKFIAGVDFTNFIVRTDGGYNPDDADGHGTHVAGIAMGTGDGAGDGEYRGVAPQARLVDVKVLEDYGAGNQGDIISGIEWCIEHKDEFNIRVLSLSLGGLVDSDGTGSAGDAVNSAVDAGLVVIAAMGNDGEQRTPDWAAADKAIAVGSVGDNETVARDDDELSSFSNTGPRLDDGDSDPYDELKPDVVAPGENIMSALANTPNAYISQSGTSMATPHVAGTVALMLEANPDLTPDEVKQILRKTAFMPDGVKPSFPDLDPKYNTGYGWGIVNAYEAVQMACGYVHVDVSIDHPSNGEFVKGEVEIRGTASVSEGKIDFVQVAIDDFNFESNLLKVDGTDSWHCLWNASGYEGNHTIYARAWSRSSFSEIDSVYVFVVSSELPEPNGTLPKKEEKREIPLAFPGIGLIAVIIAVVTVKVWLRKLSLA